VSGEIKALYVDFNSVVKKDQVLAEIDPTLYETQVAVQKANIARQENDLASQRVQLANDQANLGRAQASYERGLISLQQLENAQLQVKTRTAQIAAAEKVKLQAEAQLQQAELNVSYCVIRSPIDGVVVQRSIDVGQAIQSRVNAPQLFVLATDLRTLRVLAGVDEADIGQVRPGMPVTFTVPGFRGRTFRGQVEAVRLNAQITENVVTYPVWITADNEDLTLKPSMTANLQIAVESVPDTLQVSDEALRFRPNSNVYTWLGLPPPQDGQRPVVRLASANADSGDESEIAVPVMPVVHPGKIDERFAAIPTRTMLTQVWVYDEKNPDPSRRMRQVLVRAGISDGQSTQIITSDLQPGMQLLTAVQPPEWWLRQQSRGIFGQPQRNFGGMTQAEPNQPSRLQRGGNRGNRGGGRRGG
jgi:HlyD family secretion protein